MAKCSIFFHALVVAFVSGRIASAAGTEVDGANCQLEVPEDAVYKNPKADLSDRVADLLSYMCWDEKIAQMGGVGGILGQNSTYDAAQYLDRAKLHNGTISPGSYLNYAKDAVPVLSDLIVASKKEHRLGIPFVHIGDAVNGPTLRGTTLFPATLTMAMAWDLPLYTTVAAALRDELHACGITWVLSPEVDVARDPRSGRVGEMYGEDPWMNGELAAAYIGTVQEKDSDGFMKVATTIKHYVFGTSTGGVNQGSILGGKNHIYNILALPYINVLQKVTPASLMPSYATIDGVPAHQHKFPITRSTPPTTRTASTLNDAGIQSLEAGVELELAIRFPTAFESLSGNQTVEGVAGNVNEAVSRLLNLKFELGLFDRDLSANTTALTEVLRSEEHLEANERITSESIVLLKNNGILPLSANQKVAVLGPLADVVNTGTYAAWTNAENGNLTFLDAITATLGSDNVKHVKGVEITSEENSSIDEAVAAAKDAGIAIVVIGSVAVGYEDSLVNERTDGEGLTHASLKFPGLQGDLLSAVIESGVPTIIVLSGGQAFELSGVAQDSQAILHTFLGGEFSGRALADILIGKTNPSGKLTISFPAYSEVNPVYYNHEPSDWQAAGAIQFPYLSHNYLYPFGHGLSYTTFNLSSPSLDKTTYGKTDAIKLSVTVSNTGSVDGKQVVQVYFRQQVAPLSLLVKRLIGFSKVDVPSGSSIDVGVEIRVAELGYWLEGEYRVDSGGYEIFVGDSSDDNSLSGPVAIHIE
ncbi:uncharacterized protein CLUP02_18227 [Colletotrichum lupini]|uniref:beta-glucosidase n=1 Tax=Colletotrichum lupini TaxID=145971 RepID=A0A9Q8SHR5_9PEZI|nr:uncharacterized protein CLUP02_18227 [Colletotrichum lupini]UQC76712.1 hypothetical protein CLUP02_18227 [Colletotrichum lupini]